MKTKNLITSIVVGILLIILAVIGYTIFINQEFQPGVKQLAKKNIGIIYCSYNNDGVKDIVDIVSRKLNADVIELKRAVPYPKDPNKFLDMINRDNSDISKVVISNGIIDVKKYKLVVFATPVIEEKPCPVIQKFLNDNEKRFENRAVTSIVKYKKGGNARNTMLYFFYKLYKAHKKPNFLTFAEDKKQLDHELQIWFDAMKFKREELR